MAAEQLRTLVQEKKADRDRKKRKEEGATIPEELSATTTTANSSSNGDEGSDAGEGSGSSGSSDDSSDSEVSVEVSEASHHSINEETEGHGLADHYDVWCSWRWYRRIRRPCRP